MGGGAAQLLFLTAESSKGRTGVVAPIGDWEKPLMTTSFKAFAGKENEDEKLTY